jgi:peroxiredoxin
MHAWLIAALVVSWVLVFALAGALFVLIKQHGELIMYQQDLNQRLEISSFFAGKEAEQKAAEMEAGEAEGLPVGAPAPEFALQDLGGAEKRLEDYRGAPFVVAFFSDTCGYCLEMAPEIGKVGKKEDRPLVLISHGERETHQQIAAENKWQSDVLIEPDYGVMMAYQVMGTPSGYLVDEEGRIASKIAVGADNVLQLFKAKPLGPSDVPEAAGDEGELGGNGHVPGMGLAVEDGAEAVETATAVMVRDVAGSNINRDGLTAGTEAPNFILQDLDGKPHAMVDYRGKRVLLVFSDVTCAPCEAMSPDLVKLAEKNAKKLQVVIVSRGDVEENRRKAEAFGYPFPVVLQKSWEISKLYGMFATPIGYLIDENGIIEKDVAMGPEAILELV